MLDIGIAADTLLPAISNSSFLKPITHSTKQKPQGSLVNRLRPMMTRLMEPTYLTPIGVWDNGVRVVRVIVSANKTQFVPWRKPDGSGAQ